MNDYIKEINKTFYPTPKALINKMIAKIDGNPVRVLDPSAGDGSLLEILANSSKFYNYRKPEFYVIEKDEILQAVIRTKHIKILDSDFLQFTGPDKFDLIIGNPPFNEGDKHLLKAIEILYRGQIIFLLNAETLKNPYSNTRKLLVEKLEKLGADIEYVENAFVDAERKTSVEVAIVSIIVKRDLKDDLFDGCDDNAQVEDDTAEGTKEVSRGKDIEEMVVDYNLTVDKCSEVIKTFFKNYQRISPYLKLNDKPNSYSSEDMTTYMQELLNNSIQEIRQTYWKNTLNLDAVNMRLTSEKMDQFHEQLKERAYMDFTASNIRQFILNVIGGYENTLIEAVVKLFDQFTDYSYHGGPNEKNIHYFNGWKTNSSFKINNNIIIPIYSNYGPSFIDEYSGQWKLNYSVAAKLSDIDKVMNYFDGLSSYISISYALEHAFQRGESRKIYSTYFTSTAYKKGTIHLMFKDDDILRRFNIVACKGKKWLPEDYGVKEFKALSTAEQAVVESFEGKESYDKNRCVPLFATNQLALAS